MIYRYYSMRLSYMWPCTPHPRAVNCLIMEIRWMAWAELSMINSRACFFFCHVWAMHFFIKVPSHTFEPLCFNNPEPSILLLRFFFFLFYFCIFCLCPLTFKGRPRINMNRDLSRVSFSFRHELHELWRSMVVVVNEITFHTIGVKEMEMERNQGGRAARVH